MFQKTVNLIESTLEIIFPPPKIVKELKNLNGSEVLKRYGFYKKVRNVEAFLPYSNKFVQELVKELKYFKNDDAARICAEILLEKIEFEGGEILVPIPLSKKRFKERGFNQCEKICEILAEISEKELIVSKDKLIRVTNNKSQTRLDSNFDRAKNVSGIFRVKNCSEFRDQKLVLIDDVVTSGSTLGEAFDELKKCSPKKTTSFTIAH